MNAPCHMPHSSCIAAGCAGLATDDGLPLLACNTWSIGDAWRESTNKNIDSIGKSDQVR